MSHKELPRREKGNNRYTCEQRGGIWKVLDPDGLPLGPSYPNESHACRVAHNLSHLARAVDNGADKKERRKPKRSLKETRT